MPAEYADFVTIWLYCRSGMDRGHLPEAGGVVDQVAWGMDALAVMNAEYARITKK